MRPHELVDFRYDSDGSLETRLGIFEIFCGTVVRFTVVVLIIRRHPFA